MLCDLSFTDILGGLYTYRDESMCTLSVDIVVHLMSNTYMNECSTDVAPYAHLSPPRHLPQFGEDEG